MRPARLLEPLTGARFIRKKPVECPQRQVPVHDLYLPVAYSFVKAIGATQITWTVWVSLFNIRYIIILK